MRAAAVLTGRQFRNELVRRAAWRAWRAICLLACVGAGAIPATASVVDVNVTVRYEDRLFDATGFTGATQMLPCRLVPVEAWRADMSELLDEALTDLDGAATLVIDTGAEPSLDVALVVPAEVRFAEGDIVRVFDHRLCAACVPPITERTQYAAASDVIAVGAEPSVDVALEIPAAEPGAAPTPGGAFNMLDLAVMARLRLRDGLSIPVPPQDLEIFNQRAGNGTFFFIDAASGLPGLQIFGGDATGAGDTDEYDDTVVMHELGHFQGWVLGTDPLFGGAHGLTAHVDARLAYVEGRATFYAGLMLGSSRYVDTSDVAPGMVRLSYDYEPPDMAELLVNANNEGAITAVLWDLWDGSPGEAADVDGDGAGFAAAVLGFESAGLPDDSMNTFESAIGVIAPLLASADERLLLRDILRSRTIEFAPLAGVVVHAAPALPLDLPASVGPHDIPLVIPGGAGTIADLAVNVEIETPLGNQRKEFSLALLDPDGGEHLLYDFVTDDRRGLVQYFGAPNWHVPPDDLAALAGRPLAGTWTLRVTRRATQGNFNPARVHFFRLFATPEPTMAGPRQGVMLR